MRNHETQIDTRLMELMEELTGPARKARDYMVLFIDMLGEFEKQSEYQEHPESVEHCFQQGLSEDINEIIFLLSEAMNSNTEETIMRILTELKAVLESEHPVLTYAFQEIFEHFGIEEKKEGEEKKTRFKATNLLWNLAEWEKFLIACDLEWVSTSGGHAKWKDKKDDWKGFCILNRSNKLWFKVIIKQMIEGGFPIERVKAACEKFGIEFQIR